MDILCTSLLDKEDCNARNGVLFPYFVLLQIARESADDFANCGPASTLPGPICLCSAGGSDCTVRPFDSWNPAPHGQGDLQLDLVVSHSSIVNRAGRIDLGVQIAASPISLTKDQNPPSAYPSVSDLCVS